MSVEYAEHKFSPQKRNNGPARILDVVSRFLERQPMKYIGTFITPEGDPYPAVYNPVLDRVYILRGCCPYGEKLVPATEENISDFRPVRTAETRKDTARL